MRKLKLLFTVLFLAVLGLGNVWGATTYKLTQATSVAAGKKYVFIQDTHAFGSTTSSSALQTVTGYNTTGLAGTEAYVWTLETANGGFYMKNVSRSSGQYLNNSSSTSVSFGDKNSIWTFDFDDVNAVLIQNKSNNDRYLGYTNATSYAYKAYATSSMTYAHAIKVYVLEEEGAATCSTPTITFAGDEAVEKLTTDAPFTKAASVEFSDAATGQTITYSVEAGKEGVATVDATTGEVTIVGAGEAKIYASVEANATYCEASEFYTLTITAPVVKHEVVWVVNNTTTSEQVAEGAAITFKDVTEGIPTGMAFRGWVSTPIVGTQATEPPYVTSATMGTDNLTYYAVFATVNTKDDVEKLGSSSTFSAGDNIAVFVKNDDTYYGMYQETVSTSYVNFFTLGAAPTAADLSDAKRTWTLGAGSNGTWVLGDATNGYLYNASSNDLTAATDNKSNWTITWNSTNNGFTIKNGNRYLSCRSDLTGANQYKYRGGGTTTISGSAYFDIYRVGGITYSDFCTTILPTLAVPTNLTVSDLTNTSATLSWTAVTNAANYTVKIGETEYANITGTSYAATELTAATQYTWTVKANAEGYNSSAYAAANTFTTDEILVTKYEIDLTQPEQATIATDLTEAAEGTEVTLSYSDVTEHYHFVEWTVLQGQTPVEVTDNKFTMPAGDVTVTATFAEDAKHDAIFSVNGETNSTTYYEGESITFADPAAEQIPEGVVFKGWTAAAIIGTQTAAPEYVTEATMGAEDVTYFAVFATEVAGEAYWAETAIANLSSSDIFVFSNGSHAMTNNNNTSAAPAASSITVNSGKITSEVADNMKWKLSGNGTDGYVFYPYNTTTSWLYCNTTASSSSNNNLRVGTGDRKLWVFNSDNYLLTKDSYTARYICFYSTTPDFRGYTSTSNAFVPKFYKYTTNYTYTDYCTSVVIKELNAIVVSGTPAALWKGDEFSHEGITVTAKYANVEDEDVTANATFSGYDMATAGTQTVTVTYKDKNATYNIEVKTIANTQETAYTTAQAIELINAGKDLETEVYVKGKVSDVESFNTSYNSITYWLDNKSFEVYSGKGIEGADFTSKDDIVANADVIIKGIIKKYNSTYEFDKNNVLVSYEPPTKSNPNLDITGNLTTMSTDDEANEVSYTQDGDGIVSATSSDATVATVEVGDGVVTVTPLKAGTTTITVSVAETENYNAGSKSYTLTVKAGLAAATLPFSFDGGAADINPANGIKAEGLGQNYSSSPKLRFDGTGDYVIVRVAEAIKKVEYKIKGNTYTAGQFDILQSADGKIYTALKSYTDDMPSDATVETTAKPAADTRYIKFVYTTKNAGNVALGAINIVAASEVEPAGLAFAKTSYRFVTTDENKAVVAASAAGSDGAITYSCEDANLTIDATTGAITCTTAGTYTVNAAIAATADYMAGNASCTVKIVEPAVANSIIVAETTDGVFAMTNTLNGTYLGSVEIKKVADKYIVSDEVYNTILFSTATAEGQTTIVGSSNMYLQSTAEKNVSFTEDEYKWTNEEGALIAATATYGTLRYNTGSPRFTTYKSTTGQVAKIVSLENVAKGTFVALIGNDLYTSLAAAVAAAEDGDEIVLLADVNENIVVAAGKNIVLDLNEHTLNGAQAANTATIKNLGTLEVKNGTVKREGEGSASYYVIYNEGTMTLNCDVTGSAGSSLICNNAAAAQMTITEGNYTQTGAFIVVKNDLGTLTINGGTFTTDASKNVLNNWDQMTINGGTFNGRIFNGAYDTDNNTLTINDGTFNSANIRTYLGNGKTTANIIITGGEFTDANMTYQGPASANDAQVAISGGTFHNAVPAIYCAEGFGPVANGDGTYGVMVLNFESARTGLTAGKVGTICLDKEVLAYTGAKFYSINHKASDLSEIVLVEEEGALVAGQPYIFIAEAAEIQVAYGVATAQVAGAHNGLVGSFGETEIEDQDGSYIIYNNKFYHCSGTNRVGANRAYINMAGVPDETQPVAGRRYVSMQTGEAQVVTGMENVLNDANLQKVVVNGQLYIINNGKMMNVVGMIVR